MSLSVLAFLDTGGEVSEVNGVSRFDLRTSEALGLRLIGGLFSQFALRSRTLEAALEAAIEAAIEAGPRLERLSSVSPPSGRPRNALWRSMSSVLESDLAS